MWSTSLKQLIPEITPEVVVCSLTFTQEADEPPDEVAAAVAEGGFGQRDFLHAVARCGALVPAPEPGGLLRPLLYGQGARCRAVRRCGPARVSHVLLSGRTQTQSTRKAWISREYSTASGETSHRARHSRSARRQIGVLAVCPGAIAAPEANYPDPNVEIS